MFKLFFLFMSFFSSLSAADLNLIAKNFILYENQPHTISTKEILVIEGKEVGVLYHLSAKGYIIVPSTQNASPIKAFSFKSNFYDLPKPYQIFLKNELYAYVLNNEEQRLLGRALEPSDTEIIKRWSFLETYTQTANERALKSYIANTYLIQSQWGQGYPFNKTFPQVGEETTLTGCVQTAIAQVMRYHKHPARGTGVYTHSADIKNAQGSTAYTTQLKAVLNKPYNWDEMPLLITSDIQNYQIDEISYLMRDLAVANKAMIGINETGTPADADVLVKSFGYSNELSYLSTDSTSRSTFFITLKEQIAQERPTLFSLPGHMVVADGYQENLSGNYIHLNMGWDGAENNFYNLDATVPAGGYNFSTSNLKMIYNIKPCSTQNNDCFTNLEATDSVNNSTLQGTFAHQNDEDSYTLYLSGETLFDVNAFYVNLFDANHTFVKTFNSSSSPISLTPGLYTAVVALSSYDGYYYYFDSQDSSYAVPFQTTLLTNEQQQSIASSLQHAPVIDMTLKDTIITNAETIRINAYDEDPQDTLTFLAQTNAYFDVNFTNNLLHVKAKIPNAMSDVIVNVTSSDGTRAQKTFKVLSSAEPISFGKSFEVSGIFDSQTDINTYSVILQGQCQISGYNGYSNQAFFTRLNSLSNFNTTVINTPSLALNSYTIDTSLRNTTSNGYSQFPYTFGDLHNNYLLNISCPDANETIESILPLLGSIAYAPINDDTTTIQTYPMSIKKEWQLLSLPLKISLDANTTQSVFKDSTIVWTYQNTTWKGLGITSDIQSALENTQAIAPLDKLAPYQGFWIWSAQDYNTTLLYESIESNATLSSFVSSDLNASWLLLGTDEAIAVTNLFSMFDTIKTLWAYENGQWFATSPDETIKTHLQTFGISDIETIKKGQGFWVQR